jgi:hypothetical protein
MIGDDQRYPEKRQVSRYVRAAGLMGDGRVDLYAGLCGLIYW